MTRLKNTTLFILTLGIFIGLQSCNKETIQGSSSDFLTVDKVNSSFLVKHTGTWCPPCGGWGFTQFQNYEDQYGATEVLVACVSGSLNGAGNEPIFDAYGTTFDIAATPTFHGNFNQSVNAGLINAHKNAEVVVNSNYELELTATKIKIKTTTEFFKDIPEGDYYLTPYIVVDNIVANQAGHDDGANTVHKKSMVDVGRISTVEDPEYFGYKVASGEIRSGYKFNLEFEAARQAAWQDDDISVALVLSTRDAGGKPVFVNAFTQH